MRMFFFLFVLLFPWRIALAHPVISEILWMGSDLGGTTDEWVELLNPDLDPEDIGGWSLVTLNSKGEEVIQLTFETGTTLEAGELLIIGRKSGDQTALERDPDIVVSGLSLLNSGLLVRLKDASWTTVDAADDGSGVPFAGENPSGGVKASMERIDAFVSGTVRENWRSASQSLGFKSGSTTLGTPGFPPASVTPELAECTDDLSVGIAVQSGELSGIGKVTVNLQAVALTGTLGSTSCHFEYGDGFSSTSCNPPSHSFTVPGEYVVSLTVTNACGAQLHAEKHVTVAPEGGSSAASPQYYDGSQLILRAVLPNPEGSDTGREWVEIRNAETRSVNLSGWKLKVGETQSKWYALSGFVEGSSTLRIYGTETKFSLPNGASLACLVPPGWDECLSTVEWKSAEEGREYLSTDLRDVRVRGRVLRVIGQTIFQMALEPAAANALGESDVVVKLIGVSPLPLALPEDAESRMEMLRELLRDKTIELEFDPKHEMWDELGRLLAYAYADQQLSLQEQMLVTGGWMVDRDANFVRKDAFFAQEKADVVLLLAAADDIDLPEKIPSDTASSASFSSPDVPHNDAWDSVSVSEIFASPKPGESGSGEWIELFSASPNPLSLSGFIVQSGTKRKSLGVGAVISASAPLFVSMTELKLPLKNDGGAIGIFAPDGVLVATLEYPKLAYGQAYAVTGDDACVTEKPTPGEANLCFLKGSVPKKKPAVTPAVAKYAAFYALQNDPKNGVTYEFSDASDPSGTPIFPVLGAVIFGALGGAGGSFFVFRRRFAESLGS